MKIAIGADHGGFGLKGKVVQFLKVLGHEVSDFGTDSKEPCDYPLIGYEVAKRVASGECDRGILICKTSIGMTMVANKLSGVRAASCRSTEEAHSSREHNDSNILSMGSRFVDEKLSEEILKVWLTTEHAGGRHKRRVDQISDIEKNVRGR